MRLPLAILIIFFAITTGYSQLSGTYTVGGTAPNYPTITAAVNALVAQGVNGPVTFNIRSGIYNEHVVIPSIIGASQTNKIIFQGEARIVEEYTQGFQKTILSSDFTSGPWGNGPTPNHTYTAQEIYETNEAGMQNNAGVDGWKVTMEDFNGRTGLRIHPDCNSIGTAGCIGLRTDDANLQEFHDWFSTHLEGTGTLTIDFNIPNNPNYGNQGNANPNVGQ